jgi:hypothetical protein
MRTFLLAALLAVSSASGCSKDDPAKTASSSAEFPTMTLDEVDKAVTANEATAVDCNGDRTRKKLGVVPGAVLVTDDEAYAASELPADKTRKLIFYCTDPG